MEAEPGIGTEVNGFAGRCITTLPPATPMHKELRTSGRRGFLAASLRFRYDRYPLSSEGVRQHLGTPSLMNTMEVVVCMRL